MHTEALVSQSLIALQERSNRAYSLVKDSGNLRYWERMMNLEPNLPAARSEFFIAPDDISVLNEHEKVMRDWIFATGQPYTEHPEYKRLKQFDEEFRTEDEWRSLYFRRDDGIFAQVHADRNVNKDLEDGGGDSYYMQITAPGQHLIEFRSDFFGNYIFSIVYFGRGGGFFNSGKLALEEMTTEEFHIVHHYLQLYEATIINTRNDTPLKSE